MNELISFAVESPCPGMGGWGNGYVALPKGHPCFEMHYDAIHDKFDVKVNGGLTFAEYGSDVPDGIFPESVKGMWVVGFDTLHYGDTAEMWPDKASVLKEADSLKAQLLQLN